MNFLDGLKNETNYGLTENGAVKHNSTLSGVMDLFALGGAYRNRSEADKVSLFIKAFEEDRLLAMKCLFYLRDVRGGQGERQFFRSCYRWLAKNYPDVARKNFAQISEYGRYDDIWNITFDTPLEEDALKFIHELLTLDINCKAPSLLAKWLPSENASSAQTKQFARKIRHSLNMTSKQYRKTLSYLREKINVVERLMSAGEWDKIEFDKLPSKAGFKYRNAFARRDMIAKKYEAFAKDTNTKVNAKTLYPYECVQQALGKVSYAKLDNTERLMVNKYWDNLADYFAGKTFNGLAMVDTSGSMTWSTGVRPIDVAVSLGLYCADKAAGPFHNHFMTFESNPHLIEVRGVDFVDKVNGVLRANWGGSTNVKAAMDLILNTAIKNNCTQEELPQNLIIISDMEFNGCVTFDRYSWIGGSNKTLFENIQYEFNQHGYKMPNVVFWNVNARNDNIPMKVQDGVTLVSGFSPVTYEMIMSGKTGLDLMLEKLNSERYAAITV